MKIKLKYPTKPRVVDLLREFINQDPDLEPANYAGEADYQSDLRKIEKDQACANILLELVARTDTIDVKALDNAMNSTFSGRLQLVRSAGRRGRWELEYTTGQYYPTEYCAAACACLAQALYLDEREKDATYTREKHYHWAKRVLGERNAAHWFAF